MAANSGNDTEEPSLFILKIEQNLVQFHPLCYTIFEVVGWKRKIMREILS